MQCERQDSMRHDASSIVRCVLLCVSPTKGTNTGMIIHTSDWKKSYVLLLRVRSNHRRNNSKISLRFVPSLIQLWIQQLFCVTCAFEGATSGRHNNLMIHHVIGGSISWKWGGRCMQATNHKIFLAKRTVSFPIKILRM